MSSLSLICYSLSLSDSWVPQILSLLGGVHLLISSPTSGFCPFPAPARVRRGMARAALAAATQDTEDGDGAAAAALGLVSLALEMSPRSEAALEL